MRGWRLLQCSFRVILRLLKFIMDKTSIFVTVGFGIVVILVKWRSICYDAPSQKLFPYVCDNYQSGKMAGTICKEVCELNDTASIFCHSLFGGQILPPGALSNTSVSVRTAEKLGDQHKIFKINPRYSEKKYPTKDDIIKIMYDIARERYATSIDHATAVRLSLADVTNVPPETSNIAWDHNWEMVQSNDYLASFIFGKYNLFPHLIGTCGNLYFVEHFESISGLEHLMTLYDTQENWLKRVRLALKILKYLIQLENTAPQPIQLCGLQASHFGVSEDGKRVTYTNLKLVFPASMVNSKTALGNKCTKHSHCDFYLCRSLCDFSQKRCVQGMTNNNLQLTCERVFLGYPMAGGVVMPGLLTGPRAPHQLLKLLQECANPQADLGEGRAAATPAIMNKLRKLLVNLTY